jgi:threonyl-tRNA synthetase
MVKKTRPHDTGHRGRDMETTQISVRLHYGDRQGAKPKAEVVADILASIKERRA